ncbi:MAG: GNAT family N-acetyltransferase [Chloroflexi bacterium]|nr:GNAT family N-acetyltransferase [Chloroflexota bacterium]
MIRQCHSGDTAKIYFIINEAAKAYKGVIPADCYHWPYMPLDELEREMKRITFFGYQTDMRLVGVMGIEHIKDVCLIRHAYVLPGSQRQGIGRQLLDHIKSLAGSSSRLLVGTWADAHWAVRFYMEHGFIPLRDKEKLLKTYWDVPQRQIETSVVLGLQTARHR